MLYDTVDAPLTFRCVHGPYGDVAYDTRGTVYVSTVWVSGVGVAGAVQLMGGRDGSGYPE